MLHISSISPLIAYSVYTIHIELKELKKELDLRISQAKTVSGRFDAKPRRIGSPSQLPVPVGAVAWAVQADSEEITIE